MGQYPCLRKWPGGNSYVFRADSLAGLSAKKGTSYADVGSQIGCRAPSLDGRQDAFGSGTELLPSNPDAPFSAQGPSQKKVVLFDRLPGPTNIPAVVKICGVLLQLFTSRFDQRSKSEGAVDEMVRGAIEFPGKFFANSFD